MTIKTLLLCSAATLMVATGARAADAIVAAEPEPMEYVRVCDAFGTGFFYIPGTETCLKIGGYVRFELTLGDNVYTGEDDAWNGFTRGTLKYDARSETEYGTLRSYIEQRLDVETQSTSGRLVSAYIELGGFRAGFSDSRYDTWTDSAGDIINDDVIDYTGDRTSQISYVYEASNGFSALIGLEEGAGDYDTGFAPAPSASYRGDAFPHVIGGVKYEQDWGSIAAIGGYDTKAEAFGGKVRVDVTFNDTVSAFLMGGYQSDWDNDKGPGGTRRLNYYGPWYGDWAVWGGLAAKLSEKATLNAQGAYEEDGTFAGALNVKYMMIPGLTIMPELNYTDFGGERGSGEAFGSTIRLQRDF